MTEYVNKEYYNSIKGNCAYIDLNGQNIHKVMDRLNAEGIMFSATYGSYRNTVTVSKADAQRAYAIAEEYKTVSAQNTQRRQQRIIGNIEYAKIRDRNFINTDPATALQVANLLSGDTSIRFSGRILENSATITVSGRKNAEMVNRMIDNIRNADIINELYKAGYERLADTNGFVNIRSNASGEVVGFRSMDMVREMFRDMSNEFFHPSAYRVDSIPEAADPYYISELDSVSNDERNIFVDENGDVPVFETIENAEQYAEENSIDLTGFEEIISEPVEETVPVADVPVEHFDDTDTPLLVQLTERVSAEYTFYISQLKNEKPEVIIGSAYEISTKDNIHTYIDNEETDLTEEQIKALLSSKNVLDELYQEWNKNEYANGYDDVPMVMKDRADRLLISQQRSNVPVEHPEPEAPRDEIAEVLNLAENCISFSVVSIDNELTFAVGDYIEKDDIHGLEEYQEYISSNQVEEARVSVEFFSIGYNYIESERANSDDIAFINEHIEEVMNHHLISSLEINNYTIITPDEMLESKQAEKLLAEAKEYIDDFLENEYGTEPSEETYKDMHKVPLGYTSLGEDNEYDFSVTADLIDFSVSYTLNNEVVKTENYDSLEDMTENVLSCLNFDDFVAVGNEAVEEFEAKNAEKVNLFDTLTYNVNKTYKEFIESMDFTVVKVGDKFSLRDNANFGDIHSDKFDNAVDMTERVSIYIDDYYVKDIAERIEDIVSGDLTTVDGIIEAINNASDNEKVRAFFNDNNFDMRILDLISRHTEKVELNIAFEDAENEIPENLIAVDADDAVTMWEQGITVYNEGEALPSVEDNPNNELFRFSELSDDYYADREDVEVFKIADRIASEIWDMNRVFSNVPKEVGQPYYLSLEYGDYDEWENYNKGLNEYQNTVKALYTGNYEAVETYLDNIRTSNDVSEEMQEQADDLLNAVKAFGKVSGIMSKTEEKRIEFLSDNFTEVHAGKFKVEEFYKTSPTVDELANYLRELNTVERQGFGISGYTADANGINYLMDDDDGSRISVEFSWKQVASAVVKAFEKGKYITPEDIAERDGKEPEYRIYQIKKGDDYHNARFTSWNDLKRFNIPFDKNNYEEVYSGKIADITDLPYNYKNAILERVFTKFNIDRPEDFRGHSLSVSDVVVLENKESSSAHFVDSFGMADVTDLFFDMEKQIIDLSKLSQVILNEEYDRRGDEPDNPIHIKNTITFTHLDKLDAVSRFKEFTYDYDVMPDLDEGYTTVTSEGMLDEINDYFDRARNDTSISVSVTDTEGKTTDLNGRQFEFTLGELAERNVPVEHLEEKLAFEIPDKGYISIFERDDNGYDYTIYDSELKELDGGVYDDDTISIRQVLAIVLEDMDIELEKCREIDFDELNERIEANTAVPEKHEDVAIGDRYMYNGEEIKVVAFTGIMTDSLGEVEVENASQERFYVAIDEIRNKGEYLGNDDPNRKIKTQSVFEIIDELDGEQETEEITVSEPLPLYSKSFDEAKELGEKELYFADINESKKCAKDIDRAITDNYSDNRLNTAGVLSDVLKNYTFERVKLVLAARVSALDYDGRIDRDNIEWGNGIMSQLPEKESDRAKRDFYINSHPGLINLVVNKVRDEEKNRALEQEEKSVTQKAEPYEPKLGDTFRDKNGEVWELTSLTGVLPWYTDQCAITSISGMFSVTKNESYTNLFDTSKYERIVNEPEKEQTAEAELSADYTPSIGDVIDIDGQVYNVADISGDIISLADTETLFGDTRRMTLSELLSSDFEVLNGNNNVPVEHRIEKAKENVPVEHHTEKTTENDTQEHHSSGAGNFTITDDNFGVKTPKVRFAANVAAIRTLNTIEAENRTATPEEQVILSGYTGWGAIPNAFDSDNRDWQNEYAELKELLTDSEYIDARRSTMNAHFTSPIIINAIYEGLKNLGFEQGNILEPAMGIGNFFGAMPDSMRGSELHGVELDSLTGRIAKQLYPDADIQIKGFEKTKFANDSFDAVVGNVPFGDYKLSDKEYDKYKFYIHDYFVAKSIDKVRPGGVIAVVTSKGTMDKENPEMRKYIAQRAELLGAIRLPNDAFKKNAGTEVTSDILFFQKRERAIEINPDEIEWIGKSETDNGFRVNSYFANHPEMVLGTITEANQKYGPTENTQVIPIEGADLKQQLAEAVKNIKGTYIPKAKTAEKKKETEDILPAPANSRVFSYYAVNGSVYFRGDDDTMTKAKMTGETLKRALAMIEIRDAVRELLDMQLDNADNSYDSDIADCRARLNEKYDAFVEKYGHFDDKKNIRAFKGDDGYNFLTALESRDKETGEYLKADIFFYDTVKPNNIVTHVDTAEEALILSVSEKARVDFEYMTELCGMSKETLISELNGQIYRLPQEEEIYVTADEYLTGNIRTKLRQLEYAPEDMDVSKHKEALEAAMPKRVEAKDISVKLGAHWVSPEIVTQFINEKFYPSWKSRVEAQYSKVTGKWKIEGASQADKNSYTATHDFGTKRKNAYAIIEGILNHDDMTIKDPKLDEHGEPIRDSRDNIVKVTNHEETKAVQLMVKKIESEWSDWVFKDPERREKLVDKYNEVFNSIRHREYDGSHLNFVGMNSAITLKEHQKNAVARALYGGNTLLAHCVGAGKSYEMITIAMEGKRLGLHNKSLFAVPNSLTEQMGRDFKKLYPAANVLVATKKDFEPKNRKMLFAKIATGEWDAVIVGHSQFDRMGLSAERLEKYMQAEIESLRCELEEAKSTDGAKSFSVKEIEKTISRYEKRLSDEQSKVNKDEYIDFEQMGFDKIFVDECHMYKNLGTATKMSNVAGIGTTGSGKAAELLMKTKYLDELTGGKGLVFASGTPVSNSMTELYTMMRYLQTSLLRDCGISHFDEWAADFGTVKTDYELKPESDGKYQLKTRFAQFNNLPELMGMFKEAADIRTADTLDLEKPVAHVHEVVAQPSKIQKRLIKALSKRASKIRDGLVDPKEDNMLCITNDGRKIGLDQRLMQPGCPDNPNSKVNLCVQNVFDIYTKNTDKKSTQVIFCDMSTPKQMNRQDRFEIYRPDRESGYGCIRRKVGLGKVGNKNYLGTFDELKKYVDKNSTDIEDKLQEGDIAVFRIPSEDGKSIESRAALYTNGKFSEVNSEDLLEKLSMSPVEDMPAKTFNVYDDIKDKLVSMGVPEKEIAFIHDYDTAEKKQELFNQMNEGNVRVLLGSTQKCGAGMNSQERMIALHHLDAPLRPSDMEQRNGRIERQGNTNPEVDIFRYVTDKSFDAYLYQILENKQKFISQIMTSKTPERVCSDVDEQALDYAEVKALCAGNPLIKREMELQTQIKDLKSEKARFNENLYELQDNIRVKYPAEIKNNDLVIKHFTADLKTAESAQRVVDDEGKEAYPLKIGEKVYNTRKEAGTALKEALVKNIGNIMSGGEVALGEYRGLKLSVMYNDFKKVPQACLKGEKHHYCDLNIETDTGNMIRLDNVIGNIQKAIDDLSAKNDIKKRDLEQMKIDVEKPFEKEQVLRDLESELEDVHIKLTQFELTDDTAQKDMFERLADSFSEVMTGEKSYVKYETDSTAFMPLHVEINGDVLTLSQTTVQNGDLMYDPRIDFKIDYENKKVIPLNYENSFTGIYEEYDISDGKPETMKQINDVLAFTDDWMDRIDEQGYFPLGKDNEPNQSRNGESR